MPARRYLSSVLLLAGAATATAAHQPAGPIGVDPAYGNHRVVAPDAGPLSWLGSTVTRWARTHAIRLPSPDAPYVDSAFAFLRPLVGKARVLAIGELAHGGHQPLAMRNKMIRYAVTHLGFTAVALESGLTEAATVDGFIQGGEGNIDSVVRAGFTWEFETLPENRDLVQWLRDHNAHAARKVHFYGLDITGANDSGVAPEASRAVTAALSYLNQVAPGRAEPLEARLSPLMNRFAPDHYGEISAADRERLRADLDSLYQQLRVGSARDVRAPSAAAHARALRNAWMAIRLNDMMAMGLGGPDAMLRATITYRDSTMADDVQWVSQQEGPTGRVIVFAHDGHVMDGTSTFNGTSTAMLGHRLRGMFGRNLVIIASTAGTIIGGAGDDRGWIAGSEVARADSGTLAAALAGVGLPTFILEMRSADETPDVVAALSKPWPFLLAGRLMPIVPRQAFDAIVYFDRVTPTTLVHY